LVAAELLRDQALDRRHRQSLAVALASDDERAIVDLIQQAFVHLPQSRQEQTAVQLTSSAAGAELLVATIRRGQANGRLLTRPRIGEPLRAVAGRELAEEIDQIVAALPREDERLEETIRAVCASFATSTDRIAAGEQVFVRNCRTCHQVGGQGVVVGPQLDGIGNRGLQRVAEDVLAPYRNVDVAFRTTVLSLDDGRVLTGLVRQRGDDQWVLINSEGKEVTVAAEAIDEHHSAPLSIMPDNFGQTLSADEQTNLLAYLLNLR
jgi:putative heme-binding domain-containing protein